MIDVLTASDSFEGRVAALEDNLMEMDTNFAQSVFQALAILSLDPAIEVFAQQLRIEITQRGSAALYDTQTLWSGEADLATFAEDVTPQLASRLKESLDCGVTDTREGVVQAICDFAEDASTAEVDLATVMLPMRDVAFSPRRTSARQTVYVVEEDDDLRSIALKLYGTPEMWQTVVTTYELYPPYISKNQRGGCLTPGMRLVSGVSRIPDAEVGYLGETMKLMAIPVGNRQEWDITPQAGGGIATVEGSLCLATDCALRLVTPLGDLPEYPTYGMPEIAGLDRTTLQATQYLMAAETLKDDSRVGQVLAKSRISGMKLLPNVTVVPASRENVDYAF